MLMLLRISIWKRNMWSFHIFLKSKFSVDSLVVIFFIRTRSKRLICIFKLKIIMSNVVYSIVLRTITWNHQKRINVKKLQTFDTTNKQFKCTETGLCSVQSFSSISIHLHILIFVQFSTPVYFNFFRIANIKNGVHYLFLFYKMVTRRQWTKHLYDLNSQIV